MNPQPSSGESLGQTVYSDVASFGRFYAIIGAIFITLLCIGMFIGGIYLLTRPKDTTVPGKISKILSAGKEVQFESCTPSGERNYRCSGLYTTYTVDGKEYVSGELTMDSPNASISVGDTVNVNYDKTQPAAVKSIDENKISTRTIGWILIGLAVLMLFGAWLQVYLTQRYKFFGAAEGVAGAFNVMRRI